MDESIKASLSEYLAHVERLESIAESIDIAPVSPIEFLDLEERIPRERAPRARISLPLQMDIPGMEATVEVEACNVSSSGMFLPLWPPLPIGTRFDVELATNDINSRVQATVEVVRHQSGSSPLGMGVRFVEIPPAAEALVERLLADQEAFGNFRLEALIGRGGMAEVYRAEVLAGEHAGQMVAIKRLLPEFVGSELHADLFVSEADVSRQLNHRNIVRVLEIGVVKDTYYIAMQYIRGVTLGEFLRRLKRTQRAMPPNIACVIAQVVAEALDYAHRACGVGGTCLGLVHRDINPANVLLSQDGEIYLSDFGVAHVGALAPACEGQVLAGKAPYLAPEQLSGDPVSPESDVFALGAVLFEMLTGEIAFEAETVSEIYKKVRAARVVSPSQIRSEVPVELDEITLKALRRRRSRDASTFFDLLNSRFSRGSETRYETAGAMASDLTSAAARLGAKRDQTRQYIKAIVNE